MHHASISAYLWMLVSAVSFATMAAMVRTLGDRLDWPTITLVRTLIVFILVAVLAHQARVRWMLWKPGLLWVRGIAGSIAMFCCFFAMAHLPITDALTIIHLFPIWVALLSWPILGTIPSVGIWIAVGSGVIGVAMLQQPHFSEGNFATLSALAGSFAAAIAMTSLHLLRNIDSRAVVAHHSMICLVGCVGTLFCFSSEQLVSTPPDNFCWLMLIGVGLTATLGQLTMTKAFASGQPANVSIVALIQVAIAMFYDIIVWNRNFTSMTLIGIALIIGPAAWLLTQDAIRFTARTQSDGVS